MVYRPAISASGVTLLLRISTGGIHNILVFSQTALDQGKESSLELGGMTQGPVRAERLIPKPGMKPPSLAFIAVALIVECVCS